VYLGIFFICVVVVIYL